ncbi:GntR family transcriptional regulator [Rhodospira trueperi]|uniref:DNA-binding transcriptional regulator, GntR family n=1 Tax=Rhodospira trueperi TaxID=69960 RepID=A0A1G7AMI1_9PROT|nr:GntR family transcriptional regulator [Rhodospira trueperi]SDE16011.1 DNA-binding transcriptional regulator, GntR family [Rhodospira trueperi]
MDMKTGGGAPIYLRLRDALAERIGSGRIAPGERLPSERALSQEMGIARMTVRDALLLLQGEGLIYREDRRGYFVSPTRLRTDPTNHINIFGLFKEAGKEPGAETTAPESHAATQSLATLFGCGIGDALYEMCSIALLDGRRVCFEENYLKADVFPGFLDMKFYDPITDFVRNEYGFVPEQTGFRARSTQFHGAVAAALGVANGTPGLFITRLKSHGGAVVQVDREFWLSDILEVVVGNVPG